MRTSPYVLPLIIALLISSLDAQAASKILEYCSKARAISIIRTPTDLREAVCAQREQNKSDPKIIKTIDEVLETLTAIDSVPAWKRGEWQKNANLDGSLQKLRDTLNQADKRAAPESQSPLGQLLVAFTVKWKDPIPTSNADQFQSYVKDLEAMLRATRTGSSVLDCYTKSRGDLISSEQVRDVAEINAPHFVAAAFAVEADPANSGKFRKVARLNPRVHPINTLISYAHELKHGCLADRTARYNNALKEPQKYVIVNDEPILRPDFNENSLSYKDRMAEYWKSQESISLHLSRQHAIDEVRAYSVQVELFKELAQAAPELVCRDFIFGQIFGPQVLSTAEHNAKIDEMIEDGTFPRHIIARYAKFGNLPLNHVMKVIPYAGATNEVSPELLNQVEAAGFKVAR